MNSVSIVCLVSLLVFQGTLSQEITHPWLPRQRHLAEQQRNATADGTTPEKPIGIVIPIAPAPEPSINPFVDLPPLPPQPATPSNNTAELGPYTVCCCAGRRYYLKDVGNAYTSCCCVEECCNQQVSNTLATSICGSGSTTCSGIIIVSGVLVVICVIGCVASSIAYRRRRHIAARLGPEGAISQRDSARRRRIQQQQQGQQSLLQTLSAKEIEHLQVRAPDSETLLRVQHDGNDGNNSCPICLDQINIKEDNWAIFPCTAQHGCCRECLNELVKYTSSDRAPVVAIHCPLCRKLAVVVENDLEQGERGLETSNGDGGGSEGGGSEGGTNASVLRVVVR